MKKKYFDNNKLMAVIAISAAVALPSVADARVSGACANCHTMHNSQDGANMNTSATVYRSLTQNGCLGCHTSPTAANTGATGTIPYVMHTTEPGEVGTTTTDDTLAGGSFYWVYNGGSQTAATDEFGHNVDVITAAGDLNMPSAEPPGDNDLDWTGQRLTCAGTYGCHGAKTEADAFADISGAHHGTNSSVQTGVTGGEYTDGTDVPSSFRFLDGIKGIEDSDWEDAATSSAHNQYYAIDRTDDVTAITGTISSLCGRCHGDFHVNADGIAYDGDGTPSISSPWVRHPTDYDMGNVKTKADYADYGGGTNAYQVDAPVGSTAMTDVLSTVYAAADDAIVICLSCHRAHGSQYKDMLRWDTYDAAATTHTLSGGAEATNNGCYNCHTTKDDA